MSADDDVRCIDEEISLAALTARAAVGPSSSSTEYADAVNLASLGVSTAINTTPAATITELLTRICDIVIESEITRAQACARYIGDTNDVTPFHLFADLDSTNEGHLAEIGARCRPDVILDLLTNRGLTQSAVTEIVRGSAGRLEVFELFLTMQKDIKEQWIIMSICAMINQWNKEKTAALTTSLALIQGNVDKKTFDVIRRAIIVSMTELIRVPLNRIPAPITIVAEWLDAVGIN